MRKFLHFFLLLTLSLPAQQDSVFLLNGREFPAEIKDTSDQGITVIVSERRVKQVDIDREQIFRVRYGNGFIRYYYLQDSTDNWLSRQDVEYYRKGEKDARAGYRATGSLLTAMLTGIAAGMTGSFWAPIAPYTYMAFTGLPKVRIRKNTVTNKENLSHDAYIMGYERVARQKLKLKSLFGGTVGLILGFAAYASLNPYYPETLQLGFNQH